MDTLRPMPKAYRFRGLVIPHNTAVFITWYGDALMEGPKPAVAGTLYRCKYGRLVPELEVILPMPVVEDDYDDDSIPL